MSESLERAAVMGELCRRITVPRHLCAHPTWIVRAIGGVSDGDTGVASRTIWRIRGEYTAAPSHVATMSTALLPSPDNSPDPSPADLDATAETMGDPARFQVRPHGGVVKGEDAYIVVAVDGDRTSRISPHPMSSAQHACGVAELLNNDRSEAGTPADPDAADQVASEQARSRVLADIEREFPPHTDPIAPPAQPLVWRPGVAYNRTAADDGVNTYIVERHSSTRWELCSWNSTSFDDVEGLAGTMTPTRDLARSIAAEFSALGEQYDAVDHGGQSRAAAAIVAAYSHERARFAAAPVEPITAA